MYCTYMLQNTVNSQEICLLKTSSTSVLESTSYHILWQFVAAVLNIQMCQEARTQKWMHQAPQ